MIHQLAAALIVTALAGERTQAKYLLAKKQIRQSHAAAAMC